MTESGLVMYSKDPSFSGRLVFHAEEEGRTKCLAAFVCNGCMIRMRRTPIYPGMWLCCMILACGLAAQIWKAGSPRCDFQLPRASGICASEASRIGRESELDACANLCS